MTNKLHTCKNCKHHFQGNYCNKCGQSASTHKLDATYLLHDIQRGLFHFDHGILYTVRGLFTNPGKTIRDFINGKRIKHFKPLSLVIILATLYGLLNHLFQINLIGHGVTNLNGQTINYDEINNWVSSHFAIVTLISIPFYALASFIFFKKQGYNYIEHLVLNAFLASQRLIIFIVWIPVIYFTKNENTLHLVAEFILGLNFILMFWCYSGFFNKLPKLKSFLLTISSFILGLIIIYLLLIIVLLNIF